MYQVWLSGVDWKIKLDSEKSAGWFNNKKRLFFVYKDITHCSSGIIMSNYVVRHWSSKLYQNFNIKGHLVICGWMASHLFKHSSSKWLSRFWPLNFTQFLIQLSSFPVCWHINNIILMPRISFCFSFYQKNVDLYLVLLFHLKLLSIHQPNDAPPSNQCVFIKDMKIWDPLYFNTTCRLGYSGCWTQVSSYLWISLYHLTW